eukprot:3848431-Alexandrium_andersonii.AAC.2
MNLLQGACWHENLQASIAEGPMAEQLMQNEPPPTSRVEFMPPMTCSTTSVYVLPGRLLLRIVLMRG